MFAKQPKAQNGFTLLELIIVIAIIGTLAAVVLASLNAARVKARDTNRKATLTEIQLAFDALFSDTGSYHIAGTGSSGNGAGWFSAAPGYPNAIAQGLVDAGYFSSRPYDPSMTDADDTTADDGRRAYMRYCRGACATTNVSCVFAALENPTAADTATAEAAADITSRVPVDTHQMNYAACNGGQ